MRRSAVAMVLAAGSWMSAGCGEDVGQQLGERLVEEQIGDDADVGVDADSGEIRIDDGKGGSLSSGRRLPDSFPDEVALVEGEVLSGTALDDESTRGWAVAVQLDGDLAAVFEDAVALLEERGFDQTAEIYAGTASATLSNGAYDVLVAAFDDGSGAVTVGYTVSAKE